MARGTTVPQLTCGEPAASWPRCGPGVPSCRLANSLVSSSIVRILPPGQHRAAPADTDRPTVWRHLSRGFFHYCPLFSSFFYYIAVRCHLSCVFFLIVLFCLSFSIIISSKVWPGVEQLDLYSKMEVPKIQKRQVICIVMISLYNI